MTVADLKRFIEESKISNYIEIEDLFLLMLDKKMVDFQSLSNAYVRHLERKDHKNKSIINEATTNIFQLMLPQWKGNGMAINRALYTLNKCGNLIYSDLNKKYKYDEKSAEDFITQYYGIKFDKE